MIFALTCLTDKERAISCLVLFVHAIYSFLDTTFAWFNIQINIDSFIVTYDYTRSNRFPVQNSSFVSVKSFQCNRSLRHCASRVARQRSGIPIEATSPGDHEASSCPSTNRRHEGWNSNQGRGVVGPLLNASTSPNPSSSSHRISLPLTSCWRIGLRFSVMEIVQVMCSSEY